MLRAKKLVWVMAVGVILTLISFVIAIAMVAKVVAEEKVIELTINDHNPPQSTVARAWDEWKEWVERKSGGQLKINLIHGGALLKHTEVFKGVQGESLMGDTMS